MKLPNYQKGAYFKDPEKGLLYKIFNIDYEEQSLAADKEYAAAYKKWKNQKANSWEEGYVTKPIHKFRNLVVKMGLNEKAVAYYRASADAVDDEDSDEVDASEWTAWEWDTSHLIPATDADIVALLERRISGWGDYHADYGNADGLSDDEVDVLEKLDETHYVSPKDTANDVEKGVFFDPDEKRDGIPLYVYATNTAFRKFVDLHIKTLFEGWFKEDPEQRNSMRFDYFDTEFTALLAAQDFAVEYNKKKASVTSFKEEFDGLKPADCPEIPMVDMDFFPHQAYALACLDRSKTGIIDVDMGGGKTLLMFADALNLLKKGKIKRPALIMPKKTIPQQIAKLKAYTKGRVNHIELSTESWNWAKKQVKLPSKIKNKDEQTVLQENGAYAFFKKMITEAPPNTIIFISYNWIATPELIPGDAPGEEPEKYWKRSKWLRDECNVDYVALDESHKIKNENSDTNQSVQDLARVPYRRVATGTFVSNNPMDVWAQASWLDPTLFGPKELYRKRYAGETKKGQKGKTAVVSWRAGSQKEIQDKLKTIGYIMARKSHWLHLLPARHEEIHKCVLTPNQQKAYELIFLEMLEEIQSSKDYKKMMEAMANDQDEEKEEDMEFGKLLMKLVKMDEFLTAPGIFNNKRIKLSNHGIDTVLKLTGKDAISPKLAVADEILDTHFSDKNAGKVIIFFQRREGALHFAEHLKMAKSAVYYQGGMDKELESFKSDPSIKIICAVDATMKEGLDLQMANRVIRADIHWNPGDMEQCYGRVFRPGQEREVFIDIIITDNTAEVTKYARMVSKAHTNAQITSEYSDTENFRIIRMNIPNMQDFRKFGDLTMYRDKMKEIAVNERKEAEVFAKLYGKKMIKGKTDPDKKIPGSKLVETTPLEEVSVYGVEEGEGSGSNFILYRTFSKGEKKPWCLMALDNDVKSKEQRSFLKTIGFKFSGNDKAGPLWFRTTSTKGGVAKILAEFDKALHKYEIIKGWPEEINVKTDEDGTVESVEKKNSGENNVEIDLVSFDNEYFYFHVYKDEPNAEHLKKFSFYGKKFKWAGRWHKAVMKNKAAVFLKLKQIAMKGIKLIDLEDTIYFAKTDKALPGAVPQKGILDEIQKQKPKKGMSAEINYAQINSTPALYITKDKTDPKVIKALQSLGFKPERPAYWLMISGNRKRGFNILRDLMKAGYRVTNYDRLMAGLKKWKIPTKGLEGLEATEEGAEKVATMIDLSRYRKNAEVVLNSIEADVNSGFVPSGTSIIKLERFFNQPVYDFKLKKVK